MIINERQNKLLKPPGALELTWSSEAGLVGCTMQPQNMYVWRGVELIGCPRGSGKKLVVQGVMYIVTDLSETHCRLEMRAEYCKTGTPCEESGEIAVIPLEDMCTQMRMSHAMCYYTVQGRTIEERHVVLLDTDHQHFSVRSLIVGLSRVEESSFLHIGDGDSERAFMGRKLQQRPLKPRDVERK